MGKMIRWCQVKYFAFFQAVKDSGRSGEDGGAITDSEDEEVSLLFYHPTQSDFCKVFSAKGKILIVH